LHHQCKAPAEAKIIDAISGYGPQRRFAAMQRCIRYRGKADVTTTCRDVSREQLPPL
jgi:hypothetical protein